MCSHLVLVKFKTNENYLRNEYRSCHAQCGQCHSGEQLHMYVSNYMKKLWKGDNFFKTLEKPKLKNSKKYLAWGFKKWLLVCCTNNQFRGMTFHFGIPS